MSKKIRLTIELEYSGTADAMALYDQLDTAAQHLTDNGLLSGTLDAWVDSETRITEEITGDNDQTVLSAAPDMLRALEALYKECVMIHRYGGEICNQKAADAAIKAGEAAIAKARRA